MKSANKATNLAKSTAKKAARTTNPTRRLTLLREAAMHKNRARRLNRMSSLFQNTGNISSIGAFDSFYDLFKSTEEQSTIPRKRFNIAVPDNINFPADSVAIRNQQRYINSQKNK